ncbi:MAG TPA: alkaline phosphatase family protein [Phenylobacterium sp.]|uniref:alkaline phosphatase family protein n=1 Tax=Phenylobacterium sp. TaxID=1871053 RepID=UPI002D5CCE16|nr:alkaline phosphatase family protein [Phenylobacterium sp.]HZZ69836.1 alkaline phosphatase family protein [Phenylobacterium sp.]
MTRLLVIGAAGLDWPNLSETGAGRLAALRSRGAVGWLRGPGDAAGPAPWVSLVTGQLPEAHGVWRRDEAWGGGLRRISRASWRVSPVWSRLSAAGISTASVAWPAARPGADWPGEHIDRDFAEATGKDAASWALPPRCAPPGLREALRDLRVHPTQITAAMLAPLAPDLDRRDQSRDAKLPALAVAMARAASVQAAAAWLLRERRPDALFVHHDWLGEVVSLAGPERDAQAIDGAWRFFEGLVRGLVDLAGEQALVLVVSPGWAGQPGALLAIGPGVAPGCQLAGADGVQVAATALAALGLEDTSLPPAIAGVTAHGGLSPAPTVPVPEPVAPDVDLLRQAADAGYAPPPPATAAWRAQGLADLALMLLARDPQAALAAADAALEADGDFVAALAAKALALVALQQADPLPALADKLTRLAPRRGWGPLAQAAFHALNDEPAEAVPWLVKAEADQDPEAQTRIAAIWFAVGRANEAERVFRDLLARAPNHAAAAAVGLGMAAVARRDFRAAEEALQRAIAVDPGRAAAYLQLANVYAQSARRPEAAQAAARALSLGASPEQAKAAEAGRLAD